MSKSLWRMGMVLDLTSKNYYGALRLIEGEEPADEEQMHPAEKI